MGNALGMLWAVVPGGMFWMRALLLATDTGMPWACPARPSNGMQWDTVPPSTSSITSSPGTTVGVSSILPAQAELCGALLGSRAPLLFISPSLHKAGTVFIVIVSNQRAVYPTSCMWAFHLGHEFSFPLGS